MGPTFFSESMLSNQNPRLLEGTKSWCCQDFSPKTLDHGIFIGRRHRFWDASRHIRDSVIPIAMSFHVDNHRSAKGQFTAKCLTAFVSRIPSRAIALVPPNLISFVQACSNLCLRWLFLNAAQLSSSAALERRIRPQTSTFL